MLLEKRRLAVMAANRAPMLSPPRLLVVDLHFGEKLRHFLNDGNGQDKGALISLDFISVLPAVFIELDIVQNNENIGGSNLVKIPEPGKVMKLVDREDHTT